MRFATDGYQALEAGFIATVWWREMGGIGECRKRLYSSGIYIFRNIYHIWLSSLVFFSSPLLISKSKSHLYSLLIDCSYCMGEQPTHIKDSLPQIWNSPWELETNRKGDMANEVCYSYYYYYHISYLFTLSILSISVYLSTYSQLNHPNIVKFYAWSKITTRKVPDKQREICYAMEYLEVIIQYQYLIIIAILLSISSYHMVSSPSPLLWISTIP